VVVVISAFGTLITDNMTDRFNLPLTASTAVFALVTFLSITRRDQTPIEVART
jgi:uncharacterized membrane-anchored protein